MKKKLSLLIVIFLLTLCCQNAIDANADVTMAKGVYKDKDLPAGFTNEYKFGQFDKYTSKKYSEKLAGSYVWIEGYLTDVIEVPYGEAYLYETRLFDIYGNSWLIILDCSILGDKTEYDLIVGDKICICGQYQGYSSELGMPGIILGKYYDITTKRTGATKSYVSVGLTSKDQEKYNVSL